MNTREDINKILIVISVFLIVLIVSLLVYYKKSRSNQAENLSKIDNKEVKKKDEYTRESFGTEFDFAYINDATIINELDDLRFMSYKNKYYIIRGNEVVSCSYKENEFRYCFIDDHYKIDFSNKKILKNND